MFKPLLLAFIFVASSSTVTAHAQIEPKIPAPVTKGLESFMFVGNSFFYFNNGLPSYVSKLAAAAPESHRPKFDFTMITIGGSGFDWHDMESYFRPHAIGYYSVDANNSIVFNPRKKYYDAVVMADCGLCPIHPQLRPIFLNMLVRMQRLHGSTVLSRSSS